MNLAVDNRFEGRVAVLRDGPVQCELVLALPGGDRLRALVSGASVRALGLAVGVDVVALVPASWVVVATGVRGVASSAGNELHGAVGAVHAGPVGAEVAIVLAGGSVVRALVSREAVAELGLAPGVPACAIVPAHQVVIGRPG